jgi:DNA polymerase (family X)
VTNAEIADRLLSLAQLLSTQKENPFKVKAYRRAARSIGSIGDSLEEEVRRDADLTAYPAIGAGIAGVIREIVENGTSKKLESLRGLVKPEVAELSDYPKLDPARVLRTYKKLKISSVGELKDRLASGEVGEQLGTRIEQHIRQGLAASHEVLLYEADKIAPAVEEFLLSKCGATRVEAAGAYRRRVETVSELMFLVESEDFASVVERFQKFGGGSSPSGVPVRIEKGSGARWGVELIQATGSEEHLRKLKFDAAKFDGSFAEEAAVYGQLGLAFIPPELREGRDEVALARRGALPDLVRASDIRGELHAHSTSSDGVHSIEQMARAAAEKGYEYLGISDHSQSLKIARGLSVEDLWKQIRYIDRLNAADGVPRILKSAEVDILEDGSLDYPDDLLRELDYTVCSIHSRFARGKAEQTERILRAMDNPYFTILGHATGRLLLKRPGYEIDIDRVVDQARQRGCFLEINSSPDRLDLSAENARVAREAGVKIAITTDAHSVNDYRLLRYGIDQARRAGLTRAEVLNAMGLAEFRANVNR